MGIAEHIPMSANELRSLKSDRPSHSELCAKLSEVTKDRAHCRVQIENLKDKVGDLETKIDHLYEALDRGD